ncbi:hypothetical protein HMPREF0262_01112 [Clostridium sp. ATCC 29733]|nr:hypothetical protein HMPREF0262_01112 [Clostridium sp. ATCC 29733]
MAGFQTVLARCPRQEKQPAEARCPLVRLYKPFNCLIIHRRA